jgi:hypothetical protein
MPHRAFLEKAGPPLKFIVSTAEEEYHPHNKVPNSKFHVNLLAWGEQPI